MYTNNSYEHNEANLVFIIKTCLILTKRPKSKGMKIFVKWLINTPNDTTEKSPENKGGNRELGSFHPEYCSFFGDCQRQTMIILGGMTKLLSTLDEATKSFQQYPALRYRWMCKQPWRWSFPKSWKRHLRDFGDLIKREIERYYHQLWLFVPAPIFTASY